MSALILGFFASAWLSWAQADPPDSWIRWLNAGSFLALAIAIIGGIVAWQNRHGSSALNHPGAMDRFGRVSGIEFGTAGAGALVLALIDRPGYIACWVALIVGLHFFPLAPLVGNRSLYALGAILIVAALAGVVIPQTTTLEPSAIAGASAGAALLVFAATDAIRAVVWNKPESILGNDDHANTTNPKGTRSR